jgi:hemolysin activation/secretion protein
MDTLCHWPNRIRCHWPVFIGLLPMLAQAGNELEPGMDTRYFMQDNSDRIREQFERMRARQLQRENDVRPSVPKAPALAPDTCLPVHALRISGVTLFSPRALLALARPDGRCLDGGQLTRIVQALTGFYVRHGYIAARVVPEMSPDGVLTLQVVEGRVDRVEGGGRGAGGLLPGVIGRPLNLRDLEQGLDQANRLQSVRMRAEILPGAEPGTSTIRLVEQKTSPWLGTLSFDNRGYDATGRDVAGANVTLDNPSGHFDVLNLLLEQSLDKARYSRRGALFYSLPAGYWTFSAFGGQSAYLNTQRLFYNTVELTGQSTQYGLRIDRVTGRSQDAIGGAHVQLAHKRVRNYFLDSLQTLSSPTLTVLEVGAEYTLLQRSGWLSVGMALEKGMPWLGADRDWQTAGSGLPRAQFLKASVSATMRRQIAVAAGPLFQLDSRFYGQGSRERLPAIEQLELADGNVVRGFRYNSLASAVGWAMHNTLSHSRPLGRARLTPRVGLDVGRVLLRDTPTGYQTLLGGSVGLAVTAGRMTLDFEYNRPLYQPDNFAPEPHQWLARLSWQI